MGECHKCGECCKWIVITIPNLKRDSLMMDYYKNHGCKISGNTIHIPSKCQHLNSQNLCEIYENRPLLCKAFKGQTENNKTKYYVPKGCGYHEI